MSRGLTTVVFLDNKQPYSQWRNFKLWASPQDAENGPPRADLTPDKF